MDSINNLFFLVSIFLAFRKRIIFSILFYAVSLYTKFSLLPLMPFYFLFLFYISGRNLKKIFVGIGTSLASIVIATIPISSHPIQWLLKEIPIIAGGEMQNMTIAAFNFWFMLMCSPNNCVIPNVNQIFLKIPLSLWAYSIFALLSLPLIYLQIKKSREFINMKNVFLLFSLAALLSFLFLPGMHDRYMYPVFPLLAIAIALVNHRKTYFIIFCLLSLFNLDNIVYSWNPVVFSSTTTFYHIFYGPVLRWVISALTVLVGIWFYVKSLKEWKSY